MNFGINFEGTAGAPCAILNGVRESRAFANGVAGETDGLRYEIVCYGNGFEKVSVKVPGATVPPISPEEIATRNSGGDFVYCEFEGFSAKIYQNYRDNSVRISATAKKINILNQNGGGGK